MTIHWCILRTIMDFLGPGVIFIYKFLPHDFLRVALFTMHSFIDVIVLLVLDVKARVIITWGYCGVRLKKLCIMFFVVFYLCIYFFYT